MQQQELGKRGLARRSAALGLMLASGFAGLGYQIIWTQQMGLWLGHESVAVLAVVTAFFGGLALGALGLGQRIERSARPLRWYLACELLIAAWGVALLLGMGPASEFLLRLTGAQASAAWQWCVAFLGCFVLLLPATAAMGATLPAMERVLASWLQAGPKTAATAASRSIAPFYAANTLGAVLGVLASAFWLLPTLGLARSAGLCVALNLLCAAVAWLSLPACTPLPPAAATGSCDNKAPRRAIMLRLGLSGLLGIGYEVLVVRVLSQVSEDTVYTFALLLAVYLIGSALGAAVWQSRWAHSPPDRAARQADYLLLALAGACLLGLASLWGAETIKSWLLDAATPSMRSALLAEATLAAAAFALPTVVMGALFSQLSQNAQRVGLSFGQALGINTLGAAAAPMLCGLILAPWLGPKLALLLVPAGYLALAAGPAWRRPWPWLVAGPAVALAVMAPPLAFVTLPEGGQVLSYQDGSMAAVSVVEDAQGVSRLRINNRQQEGSSSSLAFDARQALLPLLLLPQAPQRALFLGLGTGMTAASAAQDPHVQVDAVELLPEVIRASAFFTEPSPNLHLIAADARRYVRASAQPSYQLIVADNFHPARSGSGALYTVEHFQAVRARLAAGGLFCQWLPLHQLDLASLRSITQSFLQAFPEGRALLANNSLDTPTLGLIGRAAGEQAGFSSSVARQRLAQHGLPQSLAAFGIEDEYALLGSFIAGPRALRQWAGEAPLNTDDHPVVSYSAPRMTYAPDSQARERLLSVLEALSEPAAEPLSTTAEDQPAELRLAAYRRARLSFVAAGSQVRPSPDVQQMLAQVREPLLDVLRRSPDFRPAYDPLLRMAGALARSDGPGARRLLQDLQALQPARAEAGQALLQLASQGQ
ncbi:hypothetical protein AT984_03740 [Paucibacter sp. KCTC 42545]|nr:hypothetical protein AT984_03740 [Paucibacter sp. KCTC 42545]